MAQNLFNKCNELTVQGIKNLKLMSKLSNGSSINFPLDFSTINGTNIISGIEDSINQRITMGNQILKYIEPNVLTSSFNEIQVEDRRGKYYEITINFQFPKIELYTNNQIKDFLFNSDGEFAIANAVAIITDNNDIQWIAGYDLPLVVEELELTTGGEDNSYSMTLRGRGYNRIRRYSNIARISTDFIEINDTDLLLINDTDQLFI